MKLTKFLVIASVLTARTCRTEIVLTPSLDETTSNLVKDLVEIVTSCYGDRLDAVGLAGNLPDVLSRTLSTEHLIPVVLIDNARNDMSNEKRQYVPGKFRRKINVFIIAASNPQQLDVTIERDIRLSNFWNHMASFIIVDRSSGCINPVNYLLVAWKRNAINAKVLCYENESTKTIYNYNPFTDQAPVPWQRYAVTRGIIDHPFTVFYQNYRADKSICVNLDFDKTKDLGGYEIQVESFNYTSIKDEFPEYRFRQTHLFIFSSLRIHELLWRTLNATQKFSRSGPKLHADDPGNNDISNVITDTLNSNKVTTYPHNNIGLVIASTFRGHKSRRNEFFYTIDMYSWIGIVIVYLITFMFFKTFVNQSVTMALLNIVRFTCSMGITNLTDNTSSRIYLSSILLFMVTLQVIVQCDLATQLTALVSLENIETAQDIETFGRKACFSNNLPVAELSPYLSRNSIVDKPVGCVSRIRSDTSVVFAEVTGFSILYDTAIEENLHLSQQHLIEYLVAFQIRHDWALEEAVNRIIVRLVETDALEPWGMRCLAVGLSDFQQDKTVESNSDYKQMGLADMAFAFIFLGIGLACATLCFIFELVINYKCICNMTIERRHSLPHFDPIYYCYKIMKKK